MPVNAKPYKSTTSGEALQKQAEDAKKDHKVQTFLDKPTYMALTIYAKAKEKPMTKLLESIVVDFLQKECPELLRFHVRE